MAGFQRERYNSKVWVCLMCTTKAMGDWKHGASMITTASGNLVCWVERLWSSERVFHKIRTDHPATGF